ncbi:hypothetical protein SSIG_03799 [Streptomyces filamentosus NRRL 11379]|nr:hypothetical protein SSIG_03799 [Streptomyces filamentosus NRRL 11379]
MPRVLVQRSAFAGSAFTVERHRTMMRSPAGGRAVETLVRTPAGGTAAAATGWFAVGGQVRAARTGRHPSGPSRSRLRARCRTGARAVLAHRGASAVAVVTPSANEGAVALCRSAGFTVVRENHDWVRPRRAGATSPPRPGPRRSFAPPHRCRRVGIFPTRAPS